MTRKTIFDAVRRMLGRGFRNDEIAALDAAIEAAEGRAVPDVPSEPEQAFTPRAVGPEGLALIKRFEGCHKVLPNGAIEAYPDPGPSGLPMTVGWGSTKGLDGKPIPLGTLFTRAQVDQLFERDTAKYAGEVALALGSSLAGTSQAQFDALVSFHYNTGAIGRATLTKLHRAGRFAEAAAEFARWNKAGGKVLRGLVRRRAAEEALYRSGS
ncbi:lysozyme [Tsuneonella sp. HG222]